MSQRDWPLLSPLRMPISEGRAVLLTCPGFGDSPPERALHAAMEQGWDIPGDPARRLPPVPSSPPAWVLGDRSPARFSPVHAAHSRARCAPPPFLPHPLYSGTIAAAFDAGEICQ